MVSVLCLRFVFFNCVSHNFLEIPLLGCWCQLKPESPPFSHPRPKPHINRPAQVPTATSIHPLNWLLGKAFTSYLSVEDEKITQHLESALFYKQEKSKSCGLRAIPTRMSQAGWYMWGLGLIGYWA
jgi:hypothetical protein